MNLFKPRIPGDRSVPENVALAAAAGQQQAPPIPTPQIPQPQEEASKGVSLEEYNLLAEFYNSSLSFLESYKNLLSHAVTLNEEQKDYIKKLEKQVKLLKEDIKDAEAKK